ncbi:MAG: glycosyl hydrolase 115 family protein [Pelobium sp.]
MKSQYCGLIAFLVIILSFTNLKAQEFTLTDSKETVSIFYNKGNDAIDSLMANLLAKDIERVCGKKPMVITDFNKLSGNVIFLQLPNYALTKKLKNLKTDDLLGKTEVFSWQFLNQPNAKIKKAFVITGSDARGLAYGVFKLSEQIGVNPWYWWADVPAVKKEKLIIPAQNYLSKTPSVKYRGIFINDEDWGLRPWASNTYDPQLGNIGPKTYEQVFELLLRLKANMIWPAMHPGTKAFFSYPGNLAVAKKFHIVIGTSHAEPMLRNNVDEWDEKTMGNFNYLNNKDKVIDYWKKRVVQSAGNEVIYSMGMRGVHDSGMEGVKNNKEAVPVLEQVMKDQQEMLSTTLKQKEIPQALTLYKEVLGIYDEGLKVPDDITLVWPDDNYGYIRRLNEPKEDNRKGGSGVYYHASYWGRPHDYLWLSTTPPALMREEMVKAYNLKAREIWVLNVGDIKPAEYQTQLFMDMAFDITPFQKSSFVKQHLDNWYTSIFKGSGKAIADIYWKYYLLAYERKPEFMGWSQTEPTTPIKLTAYNHFSYGDEAQNRINQYKELEYEVQFLKKGLPEQLKDAFFELVEYPVSAASNMNKKFIFHDKAVLYGQQGRLSALDYQDSVHNAYQQIEQLTNKYNNSIANAKWNGVMSMAPRKLPVYDEPEIKANQTNFSKEWNIMPEGQTQMLTDTSSLPIIYTTSRQSYFIDIFLIKSEKLTWEISADQKGLVFSENSGVLNKNELHQQRIWIALNPSVNEVKDFMITIKTNEGNKFVRLPVSKMINEQNTFKEKNGLISIFAENYTGIKEGKTKKWEILDGLGYSGKVFSTLPIDGLFALTKDSIVLSYRFVSNSSKKPQVKIYTVPTHPINNQSGLRYAVRIDQGEWQVKTFATEGRSVEWKENVLSNSAEQEIVFNELKSGKHTLQIKPMDPGIMLDRFLITFGEYKSGYSLIAETK